MQGRCLSALRCGSVQELLMGWVIMGHGDTEVSLGRLGNLAVFLRNTRVIYGGMWQEMYCEGLARQQWKLRRLLLSAIDLEKQER